MATAYLQGREGLQPRCWRMVAVSMLLREISLGLKVGNVDCLDAAPEERQEDVKEGEDEDDDDAVTEVTATAM